MTSNNTGLSPHNARTNALMNIRAARTMIDNGELDDADAALNIAEISLLDGGAEDIGAIPKVGTNYGNVNRLVSKYQQKIERLEYEKEKLEEKLDELKDSCDSEDKQNNNGVKYEINIPHTDND